jgi:hypothetical protein
MDQTRFMKQLGQVQIALTLLLFLAQKICHFRVVMQLSKNVVLQAGVLLSRGSPVLIHISMTVILVMGITMFIFVRLTRHLSLPLQ